MKIVEEELIASLEGEVHFDEITRLVYSVDASIFEILPLGVVIPKSKKDLIRIVEIASFFKIPLTLRGAATGITGGCLGEGLIIDLSKYLNKILKIDPDYRFVICEPGVIQDQLNTSLAPYGYRLGPDTSTGNRATLGGMLANNAAGAHSLHFGKMSDHVLETELILSNGKILTFSHLTEEEWMEKKALPTQEGMIYSTLWDIKQHDGEEIEKRFPNIPRRVSGYNLDELLKSEGINIAKIIAGSEGTLGIASEIRMGIVPSLKATALLLLFFDNMIHALECIQELLTFQPIALEMLDAQIIALGRSSPALRNRLNWLQGNPQALLILEMEGETREEVREKIHTVEKEFKEKNRGIPSQLLLDQKEMKEFWELRKAGLTLLLSKRTYSRAIAFLEDISIPPLKLASFMKLFLDYLKGCGKQAGIYGHVGSGCMHIRPYFNLSDPSELILMRQMMRDIASIVVEFGGSLSGEHGDGYIRSWLNPVLFGEQIMYAFERVKQAFDPLHLMNPGKIIAAQQTLNPFEYLRTQPHEHLISPETILNFEPEGGFALAADLCNGNGLCRKQEGLMCPSFQATKDEFHSTRARAQALRGIIHNKIPLEDFTSKGMYDVMDLCLSCKGCKTQCPSQVDMAKFKSEFLYHYQEKHGYQLRSRLFAHIGTLSRLSSPFASLLNLLSQTPLMKKGLEWMGISSKRLLPLLNQQKFSSWFSLFPQPRLEKKIILLNDTFTQFYHPEIGQAAVKLLNRLGFEIIVPPWKCCGRPALSKGMLPYAKNQAHTFIDHLYPYFDSGCPIIGLEPSCLLTIRDDYSSLLESPQQQKLNEMLTSCMTLDEFLAQLVDRKEFQLPFKVTPRIWNVHGHCYQKALVGMEPTIKVLKSIPGIEVKEIPSGCCGMAGSFGYEIEHEEISKAIGELILFPAIKKCSADEVIIASGTSCREQILLGTQRKAHHLAEALLEAVQQ